MSNLKTIREENKKQKWSTECPKCKKRIKHYGDHEIEYCKRCGRSVDLFSSHNKHRKITKYPYDPTRK